MSEEECPVTKRMKFESSNVTTDESKLTHFDVIDEVHGDGSASECGSDSDSSDTDLNEVDIEDMLNERLPDELKNKKVEAQFEEKFKTILEEKGQNHFEVLPEGWVKITHNSGIPLYLHTQARVCTVSRPYFLGPGSVRKHQIPITAIPCLSYKKALEKEATLVENCNNIDNAVNGTDSNGDENNGNEPNNKPITTNAVIETVKENQEKQSLSPEQITEYCKKLFLFKEIRVMRFKSWQARRKFTKSKKHIKNLQRPSLPEGTKLISFPIHNTDGQNQNSRHGREWIMNPNGKSFVCILHEYVQHALKKQPTYEFKELENAATPYSATVSINNLKYGTGFGTSKKQAKSEAARETLEVLIPEMRDKITGDNNKNPNKQKLYKDLSVFNEIRIEDPRVTEFCAKTTEPLPHSILLTCLQRNFGLGDIKIDYQVNTMKHKKNEFKMTVGKHTVTVVCKNKRDGKHQASQAILQGRKVAFESYKYTKKGNFQLYSRVMYNILHNKDIQNFTPGEQEATFLCKQYLISYPSFHPHIKTWGSLLRLYGNHSVKSFKEKKQEEQEITVLQSKAAINQPNYAILEKLQLEMSKVKQYRDAIIPIGTFVPSIEDLPIASGSNLNNVLL